MTCTETWIIPPSGDRSLLYTLRDEAGTPVNLTGWTLSIVDVTGVLGAAVTAAVVNAAAGLVRLSLAWGAGWPVTPGVLGSFRLAMVQGSTEKVWPPSTVAVQGPALRLQIPRGNDQLMPFIWPDDRDGATLAGETLDVVNASATLAPLVGITLVDAATRAVRLEIEGDLAVPLGDAGTFQLRRRIAGEQPRTIAPIAVTYL